MMNELELFECLKVMDGKMFENLKEFKECIEFLTDSENLIISEYTNNDYIDTDYSFLVYDENSNDYENQILIRLFNEISEVDNFVLVTDVLYL